MHTEHNKACNGSAPPHRAFGWPAAILSESPARRTTTLKAALLAQSGSPFTNMALSEFEIKRCERALNEFIDKRRPPVHIRSKLDFGFSIKGQSIEIFEIRPVWNDPARIMERSFAKTTFVKSKRYWKVFWKRADLRWHKYDPSPIANSIEEFVSIVDEDKYACFFG